MRCALCAAQRRMRQQPLGLGGERCYALAHTEASGQEASHMAELLPDLPDTPRPLARRAWPRAAAGYPSAVPLGREAAASGSETFSFIEVC